MEFSEQAASALDGTPADCLVVEDSKHWIRAATRAVTTVIRFCRGHTPMAVAGADALANDPDQLQEWVLGRFD